MKSIFSEFFYGIWIVLIVSVKTRVNLFPISLEIIHSYLSFKSLLETYKAEFIIQGKHYNTEPIKIIYLESSVALHQPQFRKI